MKREGLVLLHDARLHIATRDFAIAAGMMQCAHKRQCKADQRMEPYVRVLNGQGCVGDPQGAGGHP
jgi:hypothetical protein